MRVLKKRPRSDNLFSESRKAGGTLGRRIYLGLLVVFALGIGNFLWGDFFIMRGSGLVVRDRSVVATSFVAKVVEVNVKAGAAVSKGEPLVRIESAELLERLADLSTRQSDLIQAVADFRLRAEMADYLLPLANRRELETEEILTRFDDMVDRGIVTAARLQEALRERFLATQELRKLELESETLGSQIESLEAAQRDAAQALKNLKDHYQDGILRSAVDGSVGARVPFAGTVYRSGEPILEVHTGEAYVLAYLPSRYLFSIEAGMKVTLTSGRRTGEGEIAEILPVSDTLPQEFQNTLKPRERNQLAKIRLSDPSAFPVYEKVEISRSYF
ncbi:MAG: HlyD family efflux transporter periplasmic adaptor subunit [Rhodobacteraceae bacterium]|nr:HlyD family efflux transporter periplasmic adaptor subunit [Paracoccaceae bacterium]